MKFPTSLVLMAYLAVAGALAVPLESTSGKAESLDQGQSNSAMKHGPTAHVPNSIDTVLEDGDKSLDIVDKTPAAHLDKRVVSIIDSKFKMHVVSATGRIIAIIVINYLINPLPDTHESISASFDALTSVKTTSPIVASHFEDLAGLYGTPQKAIFEFSTRVLSGVVDLGLDASGTAVEVAKTTGLRLGSMVAANRLRFFNDKNKRIAEIKLSK